MHKLLWMLLGILVGLGIFTLVQKQQLHAPNITTIPETSDVANESSVAELCEGIDITNINPGDTVNFPLTITGIIHPESNAMLWSVFEGEAGHVTIIDSNNITVAPMQILSLQVDWMNSDPKPFALTIPAMTPSTTTGSLVFSDNNPNDNAVQHTCTLPVVFGS